jgi:hypothetical protein
MWELIRASVSETPETNTLSVFNFIISNIIAILDPTVNPIFFISKLSDDSIRWIMKETYRERIVFSDELSGTEDIHGEYLSKDSFYIMCCNDVITKVANASLLLIENELNLNEYEINNIQERIENINYLDQCMRLFTLPIISKVLEIPYKYLLVSSPNW